MKNRRKTYLLLGTVICIWGYIGFKILNTINPEELSALKQNSELAFSPKTIVKADTFSIKELKRDPFLGTLNTVKKKRAKITKLVNPPKKLKITYSGLIKKQDSNNSIFIINIEENQYLFKKAQTIEGVKLVKGNTNEIVVLVDNKTETISIK